MGLAPHSFGDRVHAVRIERVGAHGWRVSVDEQALPPTFGSRGEARTAADAEVARLDARALALLRRVRARLNRKCP